MRLDKLINTHVPGLNPAAIPKPFNQIHSVELGDRDLSERMGRDVKLILNAVEWKRLLPQAGSGVADFAISSITKRPYREQEFPIRFSESYFCTTHALLYRSDSPDRPIREMIAGKTVGAQSDTTNYCGTAKRRRRVQARGFRQYREPEERAAGGTDRLRRD